MHCLTFKEHEGEADSEEIVNGNGDNFALGDWSTVQRILLFTDIESW